MILIDLCEIGIFIISCCESSRGGGVELGNAVLKKVSDGYLRFLKQLGVYSPWQYVRIEVSALADMKYKFLKPFLDDMKLSMKRCNVHNRLAWIMTCTRVV